LRNLLFSLSSCLIINLCLFNNANADTQYQAQPTYQVQPTYNDASLTSDDTWHLLIAPYFWGSSINGNFDVHGISNNFSVPFNDLVNHLDFGGELHMEANNGPWTLMVDPIYVKLTDTKSVAYATLNLTTQLVIVDGGVFYNMFSNPISNNQMLSLELLAGGRYFGLENTIGITTSAPIFGSIHYSTQNTNEFLVPIVGARLTFDASQTQHFWLRGDVGGFGIDNVSDTWQGILGYSYSVSNNTDVGIAYRVLKIDYSKNNSGMNTYFYGPEVGIGFHF
jgi:hypothetical protein